MRNIFNLENLALLAAAANVIPSCSASHHVHKHQRRSHEVERAEQPQLLIHENAHQRVYNNIDDSAESINEAIRLEMAKRAIGMHPSVFSF